MAYVEDPSVTDAALDAARADHYRLLHALADVARMLEADGYKASAATVREAVKRLR